MKFGLFRGDLGSGGSFDFWCRLTELVSRCASPGSSGEGIRFFSQVTVMTDRSLPSQFQEFWNFHRSILKPSVRGYGYRIWKPFLIERTMRAWANDIDYLLCLDSGWEINVSKDGIARWRKYIDIASGHESRFAVSLPGHADGEWSKSDTMKALNLKQSQLDGDQIQATVLLVATRNQNLDFLQEWLEHCSSNLYHLLDDTPSSTPNSLTFVEHRHDQAIFCGLLKQWGSDNPR